MSLNKASEHGKSSENPIMVAKPLTVLAGITMDVNGARETGSMQIAKGWRVRNVD